MSSRLVDLLQDTIDKQRYELPQEGKHWILEGDIKLRDANRHSFAFTLDPNNTETKSKPLAFFNARPPEGIAKMCDAIVACHYNQRCYLLLIELKNSTQRRISKADKQRENFLRMAPRAIPSAWSLPGTAGLRQPADLVSTPLTCKTRHRASGYPVAV